MVDVNEIYKSSSENIKAEDIGNNMWTLTIQSAEVKSFDNGAERKIVLTFHEWDKSLPLNVTNARAISDLYGHNSNDWIGRQVMLFSMPVKFQDKMVNAVRIRAPMQQSAGPGQPQQAPRQPAPPQQNYPLNNSPQRPIDPPRQTYQQVTGGEPQVFNPPAPLGSDDVPF